MIETGSSLLNHYFRKQVLLTEEQSYAIVIAGFRSRRKRMVGSMVSDKHRCIFIEVPKTASSSIREIIGYPSKPHRNICQIAKEIDRTRFDAYYKFGFVRNPWDRMVSLYERNEGIMMKDRMSFEEFVKWAKFSSSTCIHPMPHRYQLDWFVNQNGDVIVDYIAKYERLDEDWMKISNRLGVMQKLPVVNVNHGKKGHYSAEVAPVI